VLMRAWSGVTGARAAAAPVPRGRGRGRRSVSPHRTWPGCEDHGEGAEQHSDDRDADEPHERREADRVGITELVVAIGGKRRGRERLKRAVASPKEPKPQPSN